MTPAINTNMQLLLQEGEGYQTEFKESLSDFDKELVAFANASGGCSESGCVCAERTAEEGRGVREGKGQDFK